MARKKTYKNPEVTDVQRDRVLKRRVLEERARAEEIWRWNNSKTLEERFVDYIRGTTIGRHLTQRLLKGVLWGLKYGVFYYPKTDAEKYLDIVGLNLIRQLIHRVRRDPKYRYLSLGSEILHENPDTHDKEYVMFDFLTERPKNSLRKSQVLAEWEANRSELTDSMIETTKETVERALLPRAEIERLQREERERRRHKNNNTDDEDESK